MADVILTGRDSSEAVDPQAVVATFKPGREVREQSLQDILEQVGIRNLSLTRSGNNVVLSYTNPAGVEQTSTVQAPEGVPDGSVDYEKLTEALRNAINGAVQVQGISVSGTEIELISDGGMQYTVDVSQIVKRFALQGYPDKVPASDVSVNTSNFDGNLNSGDDDLQKVAQKLDDLVVSAGATSGLNATQVNQRIQALVRSWALDASSDLVPTNRLADGSKLTNLNLRSLTALSVSGQTLRLDYTDGDGTTQRLSVALPAGSGGSSTWVDPTAQQAYDAIKDRIAAGNNITLDKDDSTDVITINGQAGGGGTTDLTTTASKNAIKDAVGEMLTGNVEDGIDVNFRSTDRTIDFSVDVSRGATLPTNPKIGDTFILTTEHTVHGDRIVVADQFSGDTIQKRFDIFGAARRTSEANIVEFIRAFSAEYAGSAPDNTLNDGVFVQVKGVLASRVAFYILQVNDGPRVKYPVSATAEASFNTYYKASRNISFATLADSDDTFRMNLEYLNGNLAFPDITYPPGIYYYSATGWMPEDVLPDASQIETDTTNFGRNIPATADTVQKALDAVDNMQVPASSAVRLHDASGPGLSITNSSVGSENSTALTIDPPGDDTTFDVSTENGIVEVEARFTINNPSSTALKFISRAGASNAADRTATIEGFTFASNINAADAFASNAGNGVEIGELPIYNGVDIVGRISLWVAKSSANALVAYIRYAGSAGSHSFSLGTDMDMAFFHTDPGAAASGGGGSGGWEELHDGRVNVVSDNTGTLIDLGEPVLNFKWLELLFVRLVNFRETEVHSVKCRVSLMGTVAQPSAFVGLPEGNGVLAARRDSSNVNAIRVKGTSGTAGFNRVYGVYGIK